MPRSPLSALMAPFLVSQTSLPKCVSRAAKLWWQLMRSSSRRPWDEGAQVGYGGVHHELAVGEGVALGPLHHLDVLLEGGAAQGGEVAVFELCGVLLLCAAYEGGGDVVAYAARAGVEDDPDALVLVEADLDEVVAGAEGAQLAQCPVLVEAGGVR